MWEYIPFSGTPILLVFQSWQTFSFLSTIPFVLVDIYVVGFLRPLFVGCWIVNYTIILVDWHRPILLVEILRWHQNFWRLLRPWWEFHPQECGSDHDEFPKPSVLGMMIFIWWFPKFSGISMKSTNGLVMGTSKPMDTTHHINNIFHRLVNVLIQTSPKGI